jgi:hypothetical protein
MLYLGVNEIFPFDETWKAINVYTVTNQSGTARIV